MRIAALSGSAGSFVPAPQAVQSPGKLPSRIAGRQMVAVDGLLATIVPVERSPFCAAAGSDTGQTRASSLLRQLCLLDKLQPV